MAWDKRGYFYRSRRVGRRVVRDYFGRGTLAQLAASIVGNYQTITTRTQIQRVQACDNDSRVQKLVAHFSMAVEDYLQSAGYHRINRGPWRKKRSACSRSMTVQDRESQQLLWKQLASELGGARRSWAGMIADHDPVKRSGLLQTIAIATRKSRRRTDRPFARLLSATVTFASVRLEQMQQSQENADPRPDHRVASASRELLTLEQMLAEVRRIDESGDSIATAPKSEA